MWCLILIHGKNPKIFLKDEKLRKKFSGRPTLVQYWLGLIIPPASIISWHSQVSTHMRVLEKWKIWLFFYHFARIWCVVCTWLCPLKLIFSGGLRHINNFDPAHIEVSLKLFESSIDPMFGIRLSSPCVANFDQTNWRMQHKGKHRKKVNWSSGEILGFEENALLTELRPRRWRSMVVIH